MTERERDLERLLTFVDAVVAIAITLLVLPLAEVGDQVGERSVAELLREHTSDIFGFLLSFVVIAQLWLGQHRIVSPLVRQSPAVVWLLLGWTLTIVFLPFPTTLVAGPADDALTKLLYIGTMAVSSTLLALLALVIARDRDLRDTDAKPEARYSAATAALFLVALVVSVTVPALGYWPLLLLLLTHPVADRLRRRTG